MLGGKQEEEPGPHSPLTWSTSHLMPLTSHDISPWSLFCAALPHLHLDQLGTLGRVIRFVDILDSLREKMS